ASLLSWITRPLADRRLRYVFLDDLRYPVRSDTSSFDMPDGWTEARTERTFDSPAGNVDIRWSLSSDPVGSGLKSGPRAAMPASVAENEPPTSETYPFCLSLLR